MTQLVRHLDFGSRSEARRRIADVIVAVRFSLGHVEFLPAEGTDRGAVAHWLAYRVPAIEMSWQNRPWNPVGSMGHMSYRVSCKNYRQRDMATVVARPPGA